MKKFKKVLLIDDDAITNFINSTVIKKADIADNIQVSVNGAEALEYIKHDCKAENLYPDLIFLDINMPVMDGFEFVREFEDLKLNESDKMEIILLTTSSSPKDIERSKALGIKMLRKPLSVQMLTELFGEKRNEVVL
jgi:CheY-like chemotaxis protein